MKSYCVRFQPRVYNIMTWPMYWFHENPEETLQHQIEQSGTNRSTDIIGIGPIIYHQLNTQYDITTIDDMVDHVILHGYPRDIQFKEETKLVISARVVEKFMNGKRYII